jgi:nickel transport protein
MNIFARDNEQFMKYCHQFQHLFRIATLVTICLLPSVLLAHGTQGSLRTSQGICVTAEYSTGQAMAYANIMIYHGQDKIPFQQGNLDRNGHFLFVPDQKGIWVVKIHDGMGHALTLETEVTNPKQLQEKVHPGASQKVPKLWKLLMGLAIILGLTGIIFWWKGLTSKKTSDTSS